MSKKEVWKDIHDYIGLYQVSNLGRVRSLERKAIHSSLNGLITIKEKILKPILTNCGYHQVNLYYDGFMKCFLIQKLVVITFLNKNVYGNMIVIDHINNIKTDNRLENLQIIPQRENASKDRKNGTSKYIGVSWSKQNSKWKVNIYINNKNIFLGYYVDEEIANEHYKIALENINLYNGDDVSFRAEMKKRIVIAREYLAKLEENFKL